MDPWAPMVQYGDGGLYRGPLRPAQIGAPRSTQYICLATANTVTDYNTLTRATRLLSTSRAPTVPHVIISPWSGTRVVTLYLFFFFVFGNIHYLDC